MRQLADIYCVGIMTIATENVNEKGNGNEKQAEDRPNVNESLNAKEKENARGIVETREATLRIVPDIDLLDKMITS